MQELHQQAVMQIPGYRLGMAVEASPWVQTFVCTRLEDGVEAIVKTPENGAETASQRARLAHEHGILESLGGTVPGIPQAVRFLDLGATCALIHSTLPGCKLLKSVVRNKPMEAAQFLNTAIRIVDTLDGLHGAKVGHHAINTASILLHQETGDTMLLEFGSAMPLDGVAKGAQQQNHVSAWLPYLSPEQTGRMNRGVDYRTDYYSLGVVFFEMLSGRLPFESADPLALIYAHIAQEPPPLADFRPSVPNAISAIVARLLSKSPEDRYQSAYGLRCDLESCRTVLRLADSSATFELGAADRRANFRIPEELFGREEQVAILKRNYDAARLGANKALFVRGPAGVGKSSLLHEMEKFTKDGHGCFVSGKFDQFNLGTPYSALGAAFRELARQWLAEPDERLNPLRVSLLDALGKSAAVIFDVVPDAQAILGPQPPLPQLGLTEAEARLNIAFSSFVRVLAAAAGPLVLCLDDLQWADTGTLKLLQNLLTDPDIHQLLVLGAFRDEEVSADHPLSALMTKLQLRPDAVEVMTVQPLDEETVRNLVAETLHCQPETSSLLASLIQEKTLGNPFSIHMFLQALWNEGAFSFDSLKGRWTWDTETIAMRQVSENVASILSRKIRSQPPATLRLLQFAACAGNRFELALVASLASQPVEQASASLRSALLDGLIRSCSTGDREVGPAVAFRFTHDRIQAAAAEGLAADERQRVSLHIARLLWQRHGGGTLTDEMLFTMVSHFNKAAPRMEQEEERQLAMILNLQAGRRAKSANAIGPAQNYLAAGVEFGGADLWERNYDIALGLYSELTQTAFLTGDHAQREEYSQVLLAQTRELQEKLVVYELRILAASHRMDYAAAVSEGREALILLDARLPRRAGKARVVHELVHTKLALMRYTYADLEKLPPMTDASKLAAMRIMMHVSAAAYFAEPDLFPVIVFRMVRMSLMHGNAPLSAFAYVCHGLALCGVLGDIEGGNAFGRLSAKILELTQARDLTAKIFFLHNVFIRHWKEPLVDSLAAFEEAARAGMDSGDLEFSSYSLFHYCACSFLSGMDFATLEERVRRHQAIVEKHRLEKATWLMRLLQFQIMELKGDDAGLEKLRRIGFTEQSAAAHWRRMRDHTSLCYLHAFAAMRRHLCGEFQEGRAEAREAAVHYASAMGQTFVPLYQFYEVLSICASDRKPTIRERWKMRGHLRRLKKWARHSPVNYGHKYLLACAEVHRVSGRLLRATVEYSKALTEARHHGFPHEEALVAERAAQLYVDRGQPELALHYLRSAEQGYRHWGAGRLVRKLQEKQRALVSGEGAQPRLTLMPVTDSVIDVAVISESYRMLSSEIETNRLVARLVELLMKNAGAQRVVFIRLRETPEVLAEGRAGEDAVLMHPPLRLLDFEEAPSAVLQYVMHSRTHLVLESARHDPAFMADPYIRRRQVQSVLCAPVIHQGQLTGMVYLENNLTPAAFTEERVKIVGMLAAQAGISMENAELLTSLEDKVRVRTVQLQEERDRSEHLLLNILPRTIADELKSAGKVQPRHYDSASILFADIVGFTRIAEENHPTELLEQLESVFFKFDEITERHGLEKLKQIGDAYMCAAGLPEPSATHAVDICLAALDFVEVLSKLAPVADEGNRRPWGLRVGVHSGPLVAGVIGRRKFAYDVWGDTVNTAARMESTGVPGKINISNATRALVAGFFETEARGMVAAKGKGEMEMFFLTGIRADLHDHRRPNSLFGKLHRQLRNQ